MAIKEKKSRLILFLILCVAILLRVYNLTAKPIWYDEADSVACAQKPLSYILTQPRTFNYKILYFLILKSWINIFGPWDYPVRFLSVILGILSVYMIFKLACILYNSKTALLSAFLFSISAFHVCHSQQARHHALMVALAIASFYFFVKLLLNKKKSFILLNALINFLIINTHPYGILIIVVQFFIIVLNFLKPDSKIIFLKWIRLQLAAIFLYLFIFLLPSRFYLQEKIWWIPKNKLSLLWEFYQTLMFGIPRFGFEDYRIPKELLLSVIIFSFIFLFLFSVSIVFSKRKNNSAKKQICPYVILTSWVLLPLFLAYTVSYIKPLFSVKHLIYVLPPFLILIARGIDSIKWISIKAVLMSLIILSSALSLIILYNYDDQINWYQAAEYIHDNLKLNDVIAICTSKEIVPFLYYFDYGNKDKLKTIDIYGEWSKEGWQEIFKYNNVIMVGLRQQRPDEPLNPFSDFKKKYIENKFSWKDKNIWMLKSRWSMDRSLNDYFYKIEEELSESHSKIIDKNFQGIRLYYWEKLQ